jgi:hypothetical protein
VEWLKVQADFKPQHHKKTKQKTQKRTTATSYWSSKVEELNLESSRPGFLSSVI